MTLAQRSSGQYFVLVIVISGWLCFIASSAARAPMAIVVIGGLITSTFLSLLVIPVVYSCVAESYSTSTR